MTSLIITIIFATWFALSTPQSSKGTLLENGLMSKISFNKSTYNTVDIIEANFEYYNPTKNPITFSPATTLLVTSTYGEMHQLTTLLVKVPESVVLGPDESYRHSVYYEPALFPGRLTLDVNGTYGSVEILQGPLVANIETDKRIYHIGETGAASLEIVNVGTSAVTYHDLGPIYLRYRYGYRDEPVEGWTSGGSSVQFFKTGSPVVEPNEACVVWRIVFSGLKTGILTIDFNGVIKNVRVNLELGID
jgi:hypothetical protein